MKPPSIPNTSKRGDVSTERGVQLAVVEQQLDLGERDGLDVDEVLIQRRGGRGRKEPPRSVATSAVPASKTRRSALVRKRRRGPDCTGLVLESP